MQAGKLRHLWTLQSPVTADDANTGEQTVTWLAVAQVYADVRPLSGREVVWARQVQSTDTHEVRLRYRSDVRATWRLTRTMNGTTRTLQISSVSDESERHRELVLRCQEAPDA